MALTNAERQARHRKRRKVAASARGPEPRQLEDRQTVMLLTVPDRCGSGRPPKAVLHGPQPEPMVKGS